MPWRRRRDLLEGGLLEAGDLDDDSGFAALLAELARAYMFVDDLGAGVPMVDRALEMAERLELMPVIADAMVTKGNFFERSGGCARRSPSGEAPPRWRMRMGSFPSSCVP